MAGRIWLDHVANGEAFSAENFILAAGGLTPHIQLFNPASSGVRVRIRSVHSIGGLGQTVNVGRHDTALTTLGLPAGFITENLLGGGAGEAIEHRSQNNAGALGNLFWITSSPANTAAIYPPEGREWGYDLLEEQGILIQGAIATTLIVNWQWVEIPL